MDVIERILPENEFDRKPENDQSLHVEKSHIGRFLEFFNSRKDTQSQTGEYHHEPVTQKTREEKNRKESSNR